MKDGKKIFLKEFGKHVKKIRLSKKLTLFDLACAINKDRQSIQRIESGNVNPSIYYLKELSQGLGVSLKNLINF